MNNIIKNRFIIAVVLLMAVMFSTDLKAQSAVGDWKIHSTWDNFYEKVIDTPKRIYFQIPGTGTWAGAVGYEEKRSSLFVYDKESEEMMAYTSLNYLNGNIINYMSYNYDKGYLLIVYIDSNIDILYDDDTVYNIPDYVGAIMTTDKYINHATFDDENNRVYLATDFGYLVLNDEKYEIAESHIYNTQINAVGRVGDRLILLTPTNAYESPISDPHLSLSSFSVIEGITAGKFLMPLTDKMFGFANPRLRKAVFNDDGTVLVEELRKTNTNDVHECIDGGYFILEGETASMLKTNGYAKSIYIPSENNSTKFSSYDFEEFWFTYPRKGYCSRKYDFETEEWTITRDYTMPSAPAVFYSVYPIQTEDYGMVIAGAGINNIFSTNWVDLDLRMSGYKDMEWTNHAPTYISSNPLKSSVADTNGPSFDPIAPNYAYFGTYRHGMVRLNFDDKEDIELYSYETHPSKNLEGFHSVFPASTWQYCHVKKPEFDVNNTMWLFHDVSSVTNGQPGFWYWQSDDRISNNSSGIKFLPVKNMTTGWAATFISLKKNKTMLVQAPSSYDGPVCVFDHNGTLDDTSDDKSVNLNNIYDQDGNLIPKTYVYCFYEDAETGKVWVGTFNGVFCFNPKEAFNENFRAQRIKVARNDGTNLADYLLDGIPVYDIKSDGAGRKWFATGGSGVVITSVDGSEVIRQMTAENTYLPNDNVYGIGINKNSNSVFLSTYYGLAEYFSDATPAQPTYDNVIAYPNPVRPDYLGWVTIEGLMDKSLVKIVDASGGFVKDLGLSQGGMISWDVTNESGKRVKTGVYYVVASQSEEGGSEAKVTKILVVN